MNPDFQKFSFEQVRIAQEFLKMNKVTIDGGSCPVGLDAGSKQCKSMVAMPPFSACKKYSATSHGATVANSKGGGKSALDIAKDILKNVPFSDIMGAYGSL